MLSRFRLLSRSLDNTQSAIKKAGFSKKLPNEELSMSPGIIIIGQSAS